MHDETGLMDLQAPNGSGLDKIVREQLIGLARSHLFWWHSPARH